MSPEGQPLVMFSLLVIQGSVLEVSRLVNSQVSPQQVESDGQHGVTDDLQHTAPEAQQPDGEPEQQTDLRFSVNG